MIRDWRQDEKGTYFVEVWFVIADFLTWHIRDRVEYHLIDAACDEARQYLKDWRGLDMNEYEDTQEGKTTVAIGHGDPVFVITVRVEKREEWE